MHVYPIFVVNYVEMNIFIQHLILYSLSVSPLVYFVPTIEIYVYEYVYLLVK